MTMHEFINAALAEDVGTGDYSTLSSIGTEAMGTAILKVKEDGIIAGTQWAKAIFEYLEPSCRINMLLQDGDSITFGDIAFEIEAKAETILTGERLALNVMQRMSGIATLTHQYASKIAHTNCKVLDTRKTTPLFRMQEKEAVLIGGGQNHRFGLYDMVMLKDNHIDYCGGIKEAIKRSQDYLQKYKLSLPIEVETRSLDDIEKVLEIGGVQRIMLDNFEVATMAQGIAMIGGKYETEASGGINLETIAAYAETGVNYASVGALTHHAVSLDLSLKAKIV